VRELVGHIDLLPTLSELFGLDWHAPDAEDFGRSLVPLLRGQPGFPARLLFAEQRRAEDAEAGDAGEMVAIQDGRDKLIRDADGREEFFALTAPARAPRPRPSAAPRRAARRAGTTSALPASGGARARVPAGLPDLGYASRKRRREEAPRRARVRGGSRRRKRRRGLPRAPTGRSSGGPTLLLLRSARLRALRSPRCVRL
jgi:arylsulfatase A-like enzyme